jgi:hypothetical protein
MKKLLCFSTLVAISALTAWGGNDIKVNSDTGKTWQGWSSIASGEQGAALVWQEDISADSSFLYLQGLDTAGAPINGNLKLGSPKYRMLPAICTRASLGYATVWMEIGDSSNGWDVYGQLFDVNGDSIAPAFKVNDDSIAERYCPDIASDSQGNFTLVWMDSRNQWKIYGQRYSALGTPVGGNIMLGDSAGSDPKICMKPDGNFAITWQAETDNILWRRFDAAGNPVSNSLRINARNINLDYAQPAIAVNDSGNYCMAWARTTSSGAAIMAQFCDSSGAAIGANIVVNQDTLIWGGHPTVVPVADNRFVVGWTDERDWVDNYCQRFSNCNQPEGNNVRISSATASGERYRQSLVLSSNGNNIIGAWMDLRDTSMSWDIYQRSIDYDALGVAALPGGINNILADRLTAKCWPNPGGGKFNIKCTTNILKGNIKLSIYNNCGQIVKTKTVKVSSNGQNNFIWNGRNADGKNVSQGVYFYKISLGDKSAFGKIILIR